jgi:hypothetical protein
MAGILTVQTIQGPTSGANANKVIIPAGQTLDASAGGMTLPAGVGGKVLQKVQYTSLPSTMSTTSHLTYVDSGVIDVNITPVAANSKIHIVMHGFQTHTNPEADNWGGMLHIYRSVNGGAYAPVNGSSIHGLWANYKNNQYSGSWTDDMAGMQYLDSPTYNVGEVISYRAFVRKSGRGASAFYASHTGGVTAYLGTTTVVGIATEIAQ